MSAAPVLANGVPITAGQRIRITPCRRRAAMTPEERAEKRREADRRYRESHAYERGVYDREIRKRARARRDANA